MTHKPFNWTDIIKKWEDAMDEKPQDMSKRCPTCQGRYWNVIHGKWIYQREKTDMICQACGRDYARIREPKDIKE